MERVHGEVLTGKERRRRLSAEEKLRIVSEAMQPGVTVSSVARRHGLHPNQVFIWRLQARAGELASAEPVQFVPVAVSTASEASVLRTRRSAAATDGSWRGGTLEIVLRNGRLIRSEADLDPDALARLAAALERT